MEWSTACPDWERKILAGESLIPDPLFPVVAEIAIEVFGNLIVPDMVGRPKMRDVMPQWVMDFVGAIFGALDHETYNRLIKEFFLLISKKNAKSTIAAGIMITALELNERDMTEAIILAPTKEVADNAFTPAMGMILFDEEMQEKYSVSSHTRTITHIATKSTLKVIAADDKSTGGSKAAYVLIDELHLFGAISNAESILTEATGGLISKADGFIIKLSTQSTDIPAGVFASDLNYARDIRDGKIQDRTYLPVLYEFPQYMLDDEAYTDVKNFYITNPSLGYSVNKDYLISKYQKAREKDDKEFQEFLSKHLNVEIGLKLRTSRWAGVDFWEQQARKHLNLDYIIDNSEVITVGLDGGGLDDLLGMAVCGRHKETKEWMLWNHAWCSKIVLERRKKEAARFEDFKKQGDLTIIDRIGEDCAAIGKIIFDIYSREILDKVGLDPMVIGGLIDGITKEGVPADMLFAIAQGYKLAGYIQTTERKLSGGVLIHCEQPLMDWCVSNAKAEKKGNNTLITKQAAGSAKIDPLIATFNAVSLMSLNPEPKNDIDEYINNMIMVGV